MVTGGRMPELRNVPVYCVSTAEVRVICRQAPYRVSGE